MRVKHALAAMLMGIVSIGTAQAQVQTEAAPETGPNTVCTMISCKTLELDIPALSDAHSLTVSKAWMLASEILAVSGLAPNFQVIASEDVPNAAAIVQRSERYLVFNPNWLAAISNSADTDWEIYAILAHEIGHHLQGHTLLGLGSRPPVELEADEYAGFALGALGASQDDAQALWQGFSEQGSATHPPRHQRLAAVERGWLRATQRLRPAPTAPAATAEATPELPEPSQTLAAEPPSRFVERDRSQDSDCAPVLSALGQAVVCTSSWLTNEAGFQHHPVHLFDDDPDTIWAEDGVKAGHGQSVAVEFAQTKSIRRILFHQGAATDAGPYGTRPRVKRLKVAASNGFHGTISLQDLNDWQFVPLPLRGIDWISFEIDQTYPGSGPQDTALSEISFE